LTLSEQSEICRRDQVFRDTGTSTVCRHNRQSELWKVNTRPSIVGNCAPVPSAHIPQWAFPMPHQSSWGRHVSSGRGGQSISPIGEHRGGSRSGKLGEKQRRSQLAHQTTHGGRFKRRGCPVSGRRERIVAKLLRVGLSLGPTPTGPRARRGYGTRRGLWAVVRHSSPFSN